MDKKINKLLDFLSRSIYQNLYLKEDISDIDYLIKLIEERKNWTRVNFIETEFDKERILNELNKINDESKNVLIKKINKLVAEYNKELILHDKLVSLIDAKYEDGDYDIADFVVYSKNNFGIKFYSPNGGYLFDFEGSLEELADELIGILEESNKDFIDCPFCGNRELRKNLESTCKGCGVDIVHEVSHSSDTKKHRLLLIESGAKTPVQSQVDDYLFFFIKSEDYEKYQSNVQDDGGFLFFDDKVEELLNKEYNRFTIPTSIDIDDESKLKKLLGDRFDKFLSQVFIGCAENITYNFICDEPHDQYINLLKYKTVCDYIREETIYPEEYNDIIEYEHNHGYNHYSMCELEGLVDSIISETVGYSFEDDLINYDGLVIEDTDNDLGDIVFEFSYDMYDIFNKISLPEFIKTYKELAEEKLIIDIENRKIKEQEIKRLMELSKTVKKDYFDDLPKIKHTMNDKSTIEDLANMVKNKIQFLDEDEIKSLKYVSFGKFSLKAKQHFYKLVGIEEY